MYGLYMLPTSEAMPGREHRLGHPFAMGSVVSIILGTITLYLEMQNLSVFQSPLATAIVPILVFGYFPIAFVVSPLIMAAAMELKYRNTKGIWWYFGGSAIFGFVYSFFIWGLLFLDFVLSGPP